MNILLADPIPVAKAFRVRVAPVAPLLHTPVMIITRQVKVQTTIVSINTSNAPRNPCLIGWSVYAEAWIIGELPHPASLLNTDLAIPILIT